MLAPGTKRKVIFVTDGDLIAKKAVEKAARNIGGRCISASAGNPTPIPGSKVVELIMNAPYDPVVVMVDDKGSCHKGKGERVLEYVVNHPDVEVIGVVAVASNTDSTQGTPVDCAVNKRKEIIAGQVDKSGEKISDAKIVLGDTVDVVRVLQGKTGAFVVGIGDIGKMDGRDDPLEGAEVTTKALKLVIAEWQKKNNLANAPEK